MPCDAHCWRWSPSPSPWVASRWDNPAARPPRLTRWCATRPRATAPPDAYAVRPRGSTRGDAGVPTTCRRRVDHQPHSAAPRRRARPPRSGSTPVGGPEPDDRLPHRAVLRPARASNPQWRRAGVDGSPTSPSAPAHPRPGLFRARRGGAGLYASGWGAGPPPDWCWQAVADTFGAIMWSGSHTPTTTLKAVGVR